MYVLLNLGGSVKYFTKWTSEHACDWFEYDPGHAV